MENRHSVYLCFLFLLIACSQPNNHGQQLVAYFPQWGIEHQPYYIKYIERGGSADKITVLNYAFAFPEPDSSGRIDCQFMNAEYDYGQVYSAAMSIDGKADAANQPLRGHFNQLRKLKARHPHLKIVISIGGWLGSVYFSDAVRTEESREYFSERLIDIFIRGNLPVIGNAGGAAVAAGIFDGIDIDWEYPVSGGNHGTHHHPEDRENLTRFYALLRQKLDAINPEFLLTAAVPAPGEVAEKYAVKEDAQYLDWYLLMTYDFFGGWDRQTGHLTNLFSSSRSTKGPVSLDATVRKFRDAYGVPAKKLIPGAAFYGRSWRGVAPHNDGFGQSGANGPGKYEPGFDYFADIQPRLQNPNFSTFWDDEAMAETMFNAVDSIFWTYDDEQSLALKARYADAYNLGGMMFWEISGDDSAGTLVEILHSRQMPQPDFSESGSQNEAPRITIEMPVAGAKITEGRDLIISTKATGSNNEIAKVEFFIDGKSIGFDSKAPFSWVWFNAAAGRHRISAKAWDKYGAVSEMVEVAVLVE